MRLARLLLLTTCPEAALHQVNYTDHCTEANMIPCTAYQTGSVAAYIAIIMIDLPDHAQSDHAPSMFSNWLAWHGRWCGEHVASVAWAVSTAALLCHAINIDHAHCQLTSCCWCSSDDAARCRLVTVLEAAGTAESSVMSLTVGCSNSRSTPLLEMVMGLRCAFLLHLCCVLNSS